MARQYSSVAAQATLTSTVGEGETSISVSTVAGHPVSFPYTLVLDVGLPTEEVVTVTNAVGTVLTVIRGADGTAGVSHGVGTVVRHMATARDFREPQQHIEATSDIHGIVGSPEARLAGLEALVSLVVPVGTVVETARPTAPALWLLCQGQPVLRSVYADLFAAIGTTYGEGDGSTTFNLPDYRGRTGVGRSGSGLFSTLGAVVGAETHTLTVDQMPSHNHTQNEHNHTQNSHNHTQNSHNHTVNNAVSAASGHGHNLGTSSVWATLTVTENANLNARISAAPSWTPNRRLVGTEGTVQGSQGFGVDLVGTTGGATSTVTSSNNATTATNNATTATNNATTATNNATGGGEAHNNVQPSIVVNKMIFVGV